MPDAVLRPRGLLAGDLVRVLSPSWCGPARYPERFARGVRALGEQLCVRVEIGRHAMAERGRAAGTRAQRAADLNAAFTDPAVRGAFWSIGGDTAAELLELVDYQAFARDPKVLCGFSDATVVHHALYAVCHAVTFYGPAVLTQWGELPHPDPWTVDALRRAVAPVPAGRLPGSPHVVEEFLDWAGEPTRARRAVPARPRRLIRGGQAAGPLLTGCLPSTLQLLGTPWLPDYRGHILVLELPSTGYGTGDASRDLWQLRNAGLLDELAGLVMGRPRLFGAGRRAELDETLTEVTAGRSYPVVTEFEIGHTDPILTLPNGVRAELDGPELTIVEAAVAGEGPSASRPTAPG